MRWYSPSFLARVADCPRAAKEAQVEETAEMAASSWDHEVLAFAVACPTRPLDGEAMVARRRELASERGADVPLDSEVEAASEAGLRRIAAEEHIPDQRSLLCVEGEGVGLEPSNERGHLALEVPITSEWGVRVRPDLVYQDDARVIIRDWKRSPSGDHRTQGITTVLAAMVLWPSEPELGLGVQEYVWETMGIVRHGVTRMPFRAEDREPAILELETLIADADRHEPQERINQWCGRCPLKEKCASYQATLQRVLARVIPSGDLPAGDRVVPGDLRILDTEELAALWAWLAPRAKIVEGLAGRVRSELTLRLRDHDGGQGIVVDGTRYVACEEVKPGLAGYDYPHAQEVVQLFNDAGLDGLHAMGIVPRIVTEMANKVLANVRGRAARAAWKAKLDAVRTVNRYWRLRTRAASLVITSEEASDDALLE